MAPRMIVEETLHIDRAALAALDPKALASPDMRARRDAVELGARRGFEAIAAELRAIEPPKTAGALPRAGRQ